VTTDIAKKDTTRLVVEKIPFETLEDSSCKLLPLLAKANLSKVAIAAGNVDPDGMASAMAMEAILTKLGSHEVNLFYKGTFNRPQNKVFRTLLSICCLKKSSKLKITTHASYLSMRRHHSARSSQILSSTIMNKTEVLK